MTKRKRNQDTGHSKNDRMRCGHCHQKLARRTYYKHRAAHCDPVTRTWNTNTSQDQDVQQRTRREPNEKRKKCGHCHKLLSTSHYYRHKSLYYSEETNQWTVQEGPSNDQHFVQVYGSDVSSSEEEQLENAMPPPMHSYQDIAGSDSDNSLSDCNDEFADSHLDDGTDTLDQTTDSESTENEDNEPEFMDDLDDDIIDENSKPLSNPSPHLSSNDRAKILLTWLVYFILIWQYKHYVSDNGIESLLKFLKQFLTCIGDVLQEKLDSDLILVLAGNLPTTLYSARKLLSIDRDSFQRFVVCPSCTKLFQMDDILFHEGDQVCARTCSNNMFPRNPRSKLCGSNLVKKVIAKDGTANLYALKTYCYKSVTDALEGLLKRPGFEEHCEKWRTRQTSEDMYSDVYDGKVWKSFGNWKGTKPFLDLPRSYGLMLNVDWFQPFKHRNDVSIGVLYMAFMNLPRHVRFRRENVVLVGIIPALKQEPESLNYFLEPLVDELKALWTGVKVNTYNSPSDPVTVRAALLCCAADIPAARKLCGFVSHRGNRGCSHCFKFFPGGFGESKDYSGFNDRDSWPRRTTEQHRRDANRVDNCKSKTARAKLVSKLGTKYTVLLELPYYSSVIMCAIDPMHNMFQGTANRVFNYWIDNDIISKADLRTIQERIEQFCATSDIGRLPGNISSNHGSYTAAQWKNFVQLYSMFVLKGVLPEQHLRYWQSFVIACRHLCKPCITKADLLIADRKLLDFAKSYESINGKEAIRPNIHLHMHLKECVENYGSVYGFWLFSFERYNGILGSFQTNGRATEIQIMRKFITSGYLSSFQFNLPKDYEEYFLEPCLNIIAPNDTSLDNLQEPFQLAMAATGSIFGKETVWSNLTAASLRQRSNWAVLTVILRTFCHRYTL